MSTYKPVRADYAPRYPRQLSDAELQELLRPALFKRFSRETLAASAVLMGALLAPGCSGAQHKPMPKVAQNTPDFDLKRSRLLIEIMGWVAKNDDGSFYLVPPIKDGEAEILLSEILPSNPPLKQTRVYIESGEFGTGSMMVCNIDELRDGTRKLFEFYGIPLEKDVPVSGSGFRFEADGYNNDYGVGFESIMRPDGFVGQTDNEKRAGWVAKGRQWLLEQGGWIGKQAQRIPTHWPGETLDDNELSRLDQAVQDGDLKIFVADMDTYATESYGASRFAYYASVVDFLNSVTGHAEFDRDTLVGIKAAPKNEKYERSLRTAPGFYLFEEPDALAQWQVAGGTAQIIDDLNGKCLELKLEPGGTATFALPSGARPTGALQVDCGLRYAPLPKPVRMKVTANAAGTTESTVELQCRSSGYITTRLAALEMDGEVQGLSFSAEGNVPLTLRIQNLRIQSLTR